MNVSTSRPARALRPAFRARGLHLVWLLALWLLPAPAPGEVYLDPGQEVSLQYYYHYDPESNTTFFTGQDTVSVMIDGNLDGIASVLEAGNIQVGGFGVVEAPPGVLESRDTRFNRVDTPTDGDPVEGTLYIIRFTTGGDPGNDVGDPDGGAENGGQDQGGLNDGNGNWNADVGNANEDGGSVWDMANSDGTADDISNDGQNNNNIGDPGDVGNVDNGNAADVGNGNAADMGNGNDDQMGNDADGNGNDDNADDGDMNGNDGGADNGNGSVGDDGGIPPTKEPNTGTSAADDDDDDDCPCHYQGTDASENTSGDMVGMATYRLDPFLATVRISDHPLSYRAAFGPEPRVTLSYESAVTDDTTVPGTLTNLGPLWQLNWARYIEDNTADPAAVAQLFTGRGLAGREFPMVAADISGMALPATGQPDPANPTFTCRVGGRSGLGYDYLVRSQFDCYVHLLPSGRTEVYRAVGWVSPTGGRRLCLSEVYDPFGNCLTLTWSGGNLVSLTDAAGKVTALAYGDAAHPSRLTKVTDPFGRCVTMEYNAAGELWKLTDPIGIVSEFQYGAGHAVSSLTTPYGTSQFAYGGDEQERSRWVEATDPRGGAERVEYRYFTDPALLPAEGEETLPAGFIKGMEFSYANSFFWSKRAYLAGLSYENATITHWLSSDDGTTPVGVAASMKAPLENRVWYAYAQQAQPNRIGLGRSPTLAARRLQDGEERYQYQWNDLGHIVAEMDPLGRRTNYDYSADGMDLVSVRQTSFGANDILRQATWFEGHLPQSVTAAGGETTTFTYNSRGQMDVVTQPTGLQLKLQYDDTFASPSFGRLTSAISAYGTTAAVSRGYTYDDYGRVNWVLDNQDAYSVTLAYDAVGGNALHTLDRVVKTTFPDGTTTRTDYLLLDASDTYDRLGRKTHYEWDQLRRMVSVTDPANRCTQFNHLACCAVVDQLIDPKGNITEWDYDIENRVQQKRIAGQIVATYSYDPATSLLTSITDAIGQVKLYSYYADRSLGSVNYPNAIAPTAPVSYQYDNVYPREISMTDGTGVTTYAYNPVTSPPQPGAGALASENPPVENATITYLYDAYGRPTGRSIGLDGSNVETVSFEPSGLQRLASVTNALGAFSYAYRGNTSRLDHVDYPNGQKVVFDYYGPDQDIRLKEIKNIGVPDAGGPVISDFSYVYDAVGRITTWNQQQNLVTYAGLPDWRRGQHPDADLLGTPQSWALTYDGSDQLTQGILTSLETGATLKSTAYTYDDSGNRTAVQEGATATSWTANEFNQIFNTQGMAELRGGVDGAPASVTLNGMPLPLDANYQFRVRVPAQSGPNNYVLRAAEQSPRDGPPAEESTRTLQLTIDDPSVLTQSYDANGNMIENGAGQHYTWDAENRLVAIDYFGSSKRTEFVYDGKSRRVAVLDEDGSTVSSYTCLIWFGASISEARDEQNQVARRYFALGLRTEEGSSILLTRDHLGSIRELLDSSGVLRAQYSYGLYGESKRAMGDIESDFTFTGQFNHRLSGLLLSHYRALDPLSGRWLSRDPIEEDGGVNLYGYVDNSPVTAIDSTGLYIDYSKMTDDFAHSLAKAINDGYGGSSTFRNEWTAAQYSPYPVVMGPAAPGDLNGQESGNTNGLPFAGGISIKLRPPNGGDPGGVNPADIAHELQHANERLYPSANDKDPARVGAMHPEDPSGKSKDSIANARENRGRRVGNHVWRDLGMPWKQNPCNSLGNPLPEFPGTPPMKLR